MLLDSRVVLWALADSPKLGPGARNRISGTAARYVSAVTHVELAMKALRGRLRLPDDFAELLSAAGFQSLPLEVRHATGFEGFDGLARHDPFDRMLLAQAHAEGFDFLTSDRMLLALDLPWIIDASQ